MSGRQGATRRLDRRFSGACAAGRVWVAVVACMGLMVADARVARAAEPAFERVVLLAAGDRVSLVFELTGEPRDVSTRRVSAAVLELDAGPVALPAGAQTFSAPTGVPFVASVAVQRGSRDGGSVLTARITLAEQSRSRVRVAGRRIYIDFSAEPTSQRQPPAPAPAPAAPPASPVARPTVPAPAAPVADPYHAAVVPAIERLDRLAPFLMSAAADPSAPVLAAIGDTLTSLAASLESLEVPPESRQAHGLLSSAIATATRAMDSEFSGDRAGQTRDALALLDRAKKAF